MTEKEFNEKYPYGLKKTIYQFQKAAFEIIKSDEIDSLINMADRNDKKALKNIKQSAKEIKHWSELHYLMLMPIAPQILLADIFIYMLQHDDKNVRGVDVAD